MSRLPCGVQKRFLFLLLFRAVCDMTIFARVNQHLSNWEHPEWHLTKTTKQLRTCIKFSKKGWGRDIQRGQSYSFRWWREVTRYALDIWPKTAFKPCQARIWVFGYQNFHLTKETILLNTINLPTLTHGWAELDTIMKQGARGPGRSVPIHMV